MNLIKASWELYINFKKAFKEQQIKLHTKFRISFMYNNLESQRSFMINSRTCHSPRNTKEIGLYVQSSGDNCQKSGGTQLTDDGRADNGLQRRPAEFYPSRVYVYM
nr:hypothetical protein BgiMline_004253 [Biomphalaria glabrata]